MFAATMMQLDRGLQGIERACALVSGAAAIAAMLLVTADAIMRHLFSAPLTFQLMLTQNYLLVALLLLAMPWGYRTGGFIRLDILFLALPTTARHLLIRTGLFLSSLYVGALAWLAWGKFLSAWTRGDVVLGVIDWPVSWSWIWLPIGLGLLSLRLMVDAISPHRMDAGTDHV